MPAVAEESTMRAATQPIALVDEGLGNSSYLVDLGDGRALVVDPERDPGPYLAAARRRGRAVAYAAETHLHADFVSGSRELAAYGARVLAAAAGGTEFPHRGLSDGDDVRPVPDFAAGHVPGSLSIPLREAFATRLGWLADPGR